MTEALGVTRGAVSQWVSRARDGGAEALRRREPPGEGQSKLNAAHWPGFPDCWSWGPPPQGFAGEIWTRRRVAQVIEREFGVSYDPSHVGRILKGCGFSLQKPALRTAQRDEEAIREWRDRRFGELKKRP